MEGRRVSRRSVESFGTIAILKGNLDRRRIPFFSCFLQMWLKCGSRVFFGWNSLDVYGAGSHPISKLSSRQRV